MANLIGISPKNPNKYLGPNIFQTSIVYRNREPTGADVKQPSTGCYYQIGCLWIVGKDPTTGMQGDLWYLSKIVANVSYWEQIEVHPSPSHNHWIAVTGTSQQLVEGYNYIPFNVALTTFTLPVTAQFGDEFIVEGYGSGGWTIAQNAGQSMVVGPNTSTTGVSGSVSSTLASDGIRFVCTVADTVFKMVSMTGNVVVV